MQKATLKMIKTRAGPPRGGRYEGGPGAVRGGVRTLVLTGGDENLSDPALRGIGRPNS